MAFSIFPPHFQQRFWPKKNLLTHGQGPVIWIHALSLGEVLSALPLVALFSDERPDIQIVFTASTRSGMEALKKNSGSRLADIRYFPLDHPVAVNRVLSDLHPDIFVLVETDLWPLFMGGIRKRKIPAIFVNARISDKTLKGYLRLSRIMGPALKTFRAIIPQSPVDAQRLLRLGVEAESIRSPANLKHDSSLPDPENPALAPVRDWLLQQTASFVWVCGSLHPGEEHFLSDVLTDERLGGAAIHTLLVPRHPENAPLFEKALQDRGLRVEVLSRHSGEKASVLIVDSMGLLKDMYALSHGALVGGSIISLRGHNPLEPAMAGIPVSMGPSSEDFAESWQGLQDAGGGFSVRTPEEMADLLLLWKNEENKRKAAGEAGRNYVLRGRGAARRAFDLVCDLLGEKTC
ncbi:3-deoxy-D-manno-octulosonic-acid transferase [Desulfobotulus alkaliphilus]|uniref:3-deoxy-D-manno-octulosonic acid transferase n=1 Tax=Desulfobotulus alkaliphilus TaxID=622671 RepID=A0A562R8V0_9BACT|nr:glycosyltransferase N-terminal domain-containing protein [Desulfobotulus alkaliphilus]TWI64816.1 3-deoxy-D-manno-octulosonic-acid transferase [Desulfobotulus alkaliphilus]